MTRLRYEVADVFRLHGGQYRRTQGVCLEQRKVMWHIEACRTAGMGGHVELNAAHTTHAGTDTVPSAKVWPGKDG